jgi:regulator of sigma E protease
MGTLLVNILLFVIILTVIIGLHELGHFYFAKKAKILCFEYSIGMGPAIYQKRVGETNYAVRAIPLGGYVSMAGELQQSSMLQIGKNIGLNIVDDVVTEIALSPVVKTDYTGQLVDFDIYGKDQKPLFIIIETNGLQHRYEVSRTAMIHLNEKSKMQVAPEERSFESKTLWQRFLVIFAGPAMNFILAFLLFLIVGFFVGKPSTSNIVASVSENLPIYETGIKPGDAITEINGKPITEWADIRNELYNSNSLTITLKHSGNTNIHQVKLALVIQTLGITNYNENGIVDLSEPILGMAAGKADGFLEAGDKITKINDTTINNWDDIYVFFKEFLGNVVTISFIRDGVEKTETIEMLTKNAVSKLGYDPIALQMGIGNRTSFNLGYTLAYPFKKMLSDVSSTINTVGLLINPNENVGIGDLSGPVGIFTLVGSASKGGILSLLAFAGFLSVNIGIINLLPIPALDGGRIIFLGYEWVTRRRIPVKIENMINNVVFILLMMLFVFVTYKDILRLF